MDTDKHIFIAIAPNHILNFENIIKSNSEFCEAVLLNPSHFSYNKDIWSHVINGELDLKYKESGNVDKLRYQITKLLGYKKFIKNVERYIDVNQKYTFYYCNLDDVLSNNIFYYLNNKNLVNSNYVVEDGILNYYYPVSNGLKLRAKSFLCKYFLGIAFTPQLHHPTNINSKKVKAQFVRLPRKAIFPEKSIKLPFEDIFYKPIKNVVLIVGQDIMLNSKEGSKYYRQRLKRLFQLILNDVDDATKIIYKPHRNGDYSIAENLLKKTFSRVELYISDVPIEVCIIKIKPSKIYSFESSAMLNLKISFDRLNIYFGILPYNSKEPKLLEIFKSLEIEIL